ncbi:MAG: hypothetical protein HGA80_06505 [Candidatus Omnitrophica bacterium]|nr:hypothetical protein [Candidatus Omnitrophota bacterium]
MNIYKTRDYQQEIHTNSIGATNFQDGFAGYRYMVFALGDSYTQGTGLPVDAAYPSQLDLLLNLRNGVYSKDYAVVNIGQDGMGAKQEICILKKYAACLGTPKYILYIGSNNDYGDDIIYSSLASVVPFEGNPRVPRIVQWAAGHLETVAIFYKLYISHYKKRLAERIKLMNKAALQEPVLNELKKTAEALHARLVVTWAQIDTEVEYLWLKDWANKNEVLFADWLPGVRSIEQAIPGMPMENHHSAGHHRTWVNSVIARAFAERIGQLDKP